MEDHLDLSATTQDSEFLTWDSLLTDVAKLTELDDENGSIYMDTDKAFAELSKKYNLTFQN